MDAPNICITGWYYFPAVYQAVRSSPRAFVVAHRPHAILGSVRHALISNVGLEWGAYDYYLKQVWSGSSGRGGGDVLLMHDDLDLRGQGIEEVVAVLGANQADVVFAGSVSGRLLLVRELALERILVDGGFWFDETNVGDVRRRWYANRGVRAFRRQLARLGISQGIVPTSVRLGIRGKLPTVINVEPPSLPPAAMPD